MLRDCIPVVLEDRDLSTEQAESAMNDIMAGTATPAQVSAFLIALKKKGETVEEITALARVMRSYCTIVRPKVNGYLLDTCGTGGDQVKTFNISTTAAFVIAAAGVHVAKHGNRSFTSRCGSADVLERLGLNLNMTAHEVEESIEQIGIGFMFAPNFHPAMKNVAAIRREIGVRTVFNILGPLTNPASANAQLIGVYDRELLYPMCMAAHNLGAKAVTTVHGVDGVDEISLTGNTMLVDYRNGEVNYREISPNDLGLSIVKPTHLAGADPEENAHLTRKILMGQFSRDDPRVQIVLANAAAGLVLCETVHDLRDGLETAYNLLSDGRPFRILRELVDYSNSQLHEVSA